ncbi:MAG: redoxin domain-containing protein [Candidatus Cloacimonadota bacterium]|nr:MAG: redoxin domain-containing protein [Candidatus Cloacimonadota bacterium]
MKYFLCAVVLLFTFAIPVAAGPNIGDPAPDFTLPDTTYTYHTLSDYQGNVVFLNFGQSW